MKIGPTYDLLLENVDSIQKELDSIVQKYDAMGLISWIYLVQGIAIQIDSIKIKDKAARRQGLGSQLMTDITALCDKYGLLSVLTADGSETPLSVLEKFYKKFGYKLNKGRYKDFRFRSGMIRYPHQ